MTTNNKDLKNVYNKQELNWYSGYDESITLARMGDPWKGKKVLEIGCGQGHLASILSYAGAEVTALDYAADEIRRAVDNYDMHRVNFMSGDYRKDLKKQRFNTIIMQGVIEHFDEPLKELKWITDNLISPASGSLLLISVPHWWNPRGFILQTLRLLLDAKISLTDLHYFLPGDIVSLAKNSGWIISKYEICDESRGSGADAIADLVDRIPKAYPKVGKKRLKEFTRYMKKMLLDPTVGNTGLGATAVYRFEK